MAPNTTLMSTPSVHGASPVGLHLEPVPASPGGPGRLSASAGRHQASILALCEEIGIPIDELAAHYQCELARLSAIAAVTDYLPVLVAKKVRALYRQRMGP